ncbi:MAG: long-chain fatty acid--CoA ligase [Desulfobacterales bacterium]|jgi:long-chain acyl-CoA synthetase|nr:long-chain fatty acid--CoA ligase [Desulfobacterales bacterium]
MNISQHVDRAAKFFPEQAAIVFDGATLTYAEVNARVNRLAHALEANGVKRGQRVAIYLPNIPAFAICYLAVVRIGAIALSINAMYKSEELTYILNDSGSDLVFTTGELLPHIPRTQCPTVKQVVVCEGDPQGHPTLDGWLAKGSDRGRPAHMDPEDPAVLLYTSGTTGFPKGATLSHGNVVANAWATVHHAGYTRNDRMILFLPLFHVFGQNFIMNATFQAMATLVLHRRFVPERVLESVRRDRVSMFFAVPTIYIGLLNLPAADESLASIRYDFSAAATMPREISARWRQRFGRPVFEGYGLTECSPFACYNHDFRHKFGSVGTPIENTEIRILDADDQELPLGQWGEICIKGPGVMRGYWNKPEETRQALRSGWLHSGDIGTMDDEGYVFIVDRVKDMINVSGFKVWPAEVEQFLYKHPAVQEVAVYGKPHPEKGEAVVAAIILKEGAAATGEEIIAYCRSHMAAYKAPTRVDFLAELPKSATGKILKRTLRDTA